MIWRARLFGAYRLADGKNGQLRMFELEADAAKFTRSSCRIDTIQHHDQALLHPSPNPLKVALYLEEAGLPHALIAIDTRKGEQHTPAFRAINPNAKTPALVDGDATVFDSNAILLYLAEKAWPVPAAQHAGRARRCSRG